MSSSTIEITEKLLSDAGGWEAMKRARALVEMGRVVSAAYAPPLLKGVVRDGNTQFSAGLKISSRSNIENICNCRAARGWGTICEHSLAVGLATIRRRTEESSGTPIVSAEPKAATKIEPFFSATKGSERIVLYVILSPNFQAAWEKDAVMIGAEVELGGRKILIHALDQKTTYRCAAEDVRAIETLRELNNGALSGMMILPRERCLAVLETLRGHPRVTFGKNAQVDVAQLLDSLRQSVPTVTASDGTIGNNAVQSGQPQFSLMIEGSLNHLSARLQCTYGERIVTAGLTPVGDTFSYPDPLNPKRRLTRNLLAEREALERLTRRGFTGPDATGHYTLRSESAILSFFAQELPRLEREWRVSIGARFSNITQNIERIEPRMEIRSSGENWFDLTVSIATPGGETFSGAEIQRLLQMGQNHVRLKNNRLAVFDSEMLDELQNVLRDCDPHQIQPGTYRVDRVHAGYIDASLGCQAQIVTTPAWQRCTREQRRLEKIEPIALGALEDVLRPYQKHGVYWMNFLARNGFGGILADEMGLGKTLQALALLLALRVAGTQALIVCPSSLIQNWRREAERFTPTLRVLVVEGANRRALFTTMQEADLLITSYPLLRQDIDHYRGIQFSTVILDEAQHIKNPETQNAQSATALKAHNRFVLTGTPVENSVCDLWSIMNFLMPGYLGSRSEFRDHYEVPISRGTPQVQGRLAKRMQPFLLRRLKRDVATDLPEKIEQVTFCELTLRQSSIYETLLKEGRRQIQQACTDNDRNSSRMLMLTTLLRLRQVCCDVRLLELPDTVPIENSAKLELLRELLREAIDGSHKVLIFSQFVSMLKLIKEQLERDKVLFAYLDGETKDRIAAVDRFQNTPDIPVFLISLKAGGVGLNLTAADTVIHFDPWWNPAVEAQATDRSHRIGQKRIVTSYKLIARGTVEEKILNLQHAKRNIAASAVGSEESFIKGLTAEDIQALLG